MSSLLAIDEGDACVAGCKGRFEIRYPDDGGCSCHISAPCRHCTSSFLACDKCGIESSFVELIAYQAIYGHLGEQELAAEPVKQEGTAESLTLPVHRAMRRQNGVPGHRPWEANWLPGGRS